jgi:hypothetical protein
MGEPADGDEVDARPRNPPCGLGRNAARGLADRAVADHSDAALEIVQRHIVEEHGVDADAERLFELSERVDLDLDLDKVADIGAGAADSLRDRTRDRDVVVLDQNRFVEAEAVIGAVASAHHIRGVTSTAGVSSNAHSTMRYDPGGFPDDGSLR